MKNYLFFLLLIPFFLIGCKSETKEDTSKAAPEKIEIPAFDADSAFAFVKQQTDFGPRVPNSEAHQLCGLYLQSQLARFCDTVMVQSFTATAYDGTKLKSSNIIGSFAPQKTKRVLLAAHWDSRPIADHDPVEANRTKPIDGANDGASGVGVLLEVARQLQLKNADVGVDIIFFDAEDYGTPSSENIPGDWWCLGSQYWTKNPHVDNYTANFGILLDMVGGADAKFYHETFSSHYAQDIVSMVWSTAYKLGYGKFFVNQPANPITDDHYYVNKNTKIRMIDIIHQDNTSGTGFNPTWHTINDNIQHIAPQTLYAVGTTMMAVLYNQD